MSQNVCSHDGCERSVYGYGLCNTHYRQAKTRKELPSYKPCNFHGCEATQYGNGYCMGHNRQFKSGQELRPLRHTLTDDEKFWQNVSKGSPDECWEWTAYRNRKGYGRGKYKGRMWLSHRASYTIAHGSIPDGMQIDHTCWNPACVNPGHLRLADRYQNGQNRQGAWKSNSTGVRGVNVNGREGTYRARGTKGGKQVYLGSYATLAEAESVVVAWRREHAPSSLMDRRPAP